MVFSLQERARGPLSASAWAPSAPDEALDDYERHVAHAAPHLKLLRVPQQYKADNDRKPSSDSLRDEAPCSKYSDSHPGLTPGMFALFCPHGFCVAFKIMSRSEGPKTAFDMLYHRCRLGEKFVILPLVCFCLARLLCHVCMPQ